MPGRTHGRTHTPLYKRWLIMKRACYNESSQAYPNFGRKGIKVADVWRHDFLEFERYAYNHGYSKETPIIDRIDQTKDFEPGNVIFVTHGQRQKSKAVAQKITYKGESKSVSDWAKDIGVSRQALYSRINRSSDPVKAIDEAFASQRELKDKNHPDE